MMQDALTQPIVSWFWWRKLLFRFSCFYLVLYMSPWTWLADLPLLTVMAEQYGKAESWLVATANGHLFHVKDVLVPLNGSGDTSYGYAQLCFFALASVAGALVWTVFDKRRNYELGYYWLLVAVRYYVAMVALIYGITKLFGQQMIFPTLSALATPLGDFLPMRFSWFFIGYSTPYQFFSGLVEVVAGLLLLFRRTSTLGAFVAASVFLNVMIMNLCYDIPVKLFSIHLFGLSNFLLIGDAKRLLNFFVFNKPTQPAPRLTLSNKRLRIARMALKTAFVILFLIRPFYNMYDSTTGSNGSPVPGKLTTGFFEVEQFRAGVADSLRWKDVIFEKTNTGSIQTADTLLRQRYRRGYFSYSLDSAKSTIAFKKFAADTNALFTLQYAMPDTNHILLRGKIRTDSVVIGLRRQNRHFQLAERQFHWLSEANR